MENSSQILIGTPAFGGLLYQSYVISLVNTLRACDKEEIPISVYTVGNESLINRARNLIATYVLTNPQYEYLLFIDADMGWEAVDLMKLLAADKKVIGGTYPLKQIEPKLNFNAFPDEVDQFPNLKAPEGYNRYTEEVNENGLVRVKHLPTGFLLIHRSVFETLKSKVEVYQNRDHKTGVLETFYNFFPISVNGGILESEDWGFSRLCSENGIEIYLEPTVILDHSGTYTFKWS